MLVWILQTGEPLNCDEDNIRPMRAMNLSKALISRGHKVEIISTKFFHQKKTFRKLKSFKMGENELLETLINSTGYKSNIGIGRIIDHHVLSFNLLLYLLMKKEKPDILFVGFPPIEWSLTAVFYSLIKSVPLVLDVKDLWPDMFWDKEGISKYKKALLKLLFTPYRIYCSFIATYSCYITGPTKLIAEYFKNNYQNNLISSILKIPKAKTFTSPIVPPSEQNKINLEFKKKGDPKQCLNILFIGSLMSVYDFQTVKDSLNTLRSNNHKVQLFIAGKGGSEKNIEFIFKKFKNVQFLGWINRKEAFQLANKCHIALAPYQNIKNYRLNLVNKYIDYMSLGLPVLSPLEGYVEQVIKKHEIGWHYNPGNQEDLAEIIASIISSPEKIIQRSKNAYKLFEKKYKYDVVYNHLVDKLEEISTQDT